MANFFLRIFNFINSKKIVSLVGLFVIFAGLGLIASNIQFEEDITKLLPINKDNEEVSKVFTSMKFADKIIVNITLDKDGSINDLTEFADEFIDSLHTTSGKYIANIQGKVNDQAILKTLDFVYNNLPLFLNNKDYETIANKLTKDSLEVITKNNYKTLVSPSGIVVKKNIVKDPLGVSFLGLKKLQSLSLGDDMSITNGYLLTKDKKHILLFISPKLSSNETGENAKFSEELYALSNAFNTTYNNKVHVEYFGGALVAVENAKQIKHDIQFTVGIAMTVLLLILIVFYRKVWLPFILFVPTIFGGLLAIVVLCIVRDKISAISLGIGSVLLGVTLDYSLHVLTHIRDNNSAKSLYAEISKPILMSSFTTALAFFCLLFLDSQALQDLGIFAGVSSLGASFFALIFIPHLYKKPVIKKKYRNTLIDKFSAIPLHKSKWIFIGLAAICVISIFTYKKVLFNKDLTKLNYEPPVLMEAQHNLEQITNIASKSVYVAGYGTTLQEALAVNDSIYKVLNKLEASKQIIDFSSIGALVQSAKGQTNKIKQWNSFWTANEKQFVEDNLVESGSKLGFKPTTHQQFYKLLDKEFTPLNPADFSVLKVLNIEDYIGGEEGFYTVTTLVKLDDDKIDSFTKQLNKLSGVVVIDRKGINEQFLGNLKNDFNDLVFYSLIVVLIILCISYRSLSLTIVTAIPIGLTWFITIGIMGLLGIQFNIFNIIISSFIFGLGIDYGIFITNGLLHEYRTGERVLNTHKTSIILSVITTILGVGVLIFAKHPALYTISVVSIIGILSAMLIAFTVQPILFRLFIGSKKLRPKSLRVLLNASISFSYYGLGTVLISVAVTVLTKLLPFKKKQIMERFHKLASRFMTSVLYSNPFVTKKVINNVGETFEKPAVIIANHTSFLDTLAIEMLHSKIIFLVNDWVYNSPVFARAMKLAGYYPVSEGIENGLDHLKEKVAEGYSIMVFPEGSRSYTNKMNRFHKGAFYLAEQFNLDIVPVLIHGNSEVIPKGDFVIRNGSITVKVLDRIDANDVAFGKNTRERTKLISTYFKQQFLDFRRQAEGATYFHELVLNEFRYKGDALYKQVKHDLATYKNEYLSVLHLVTNGKYISHISNNNGQLDFLLALDSPHLKIDSYIEDAEIRKVLKNSYITNNHYKINYLETEDDFIAAINTSDTLLIDTITNINTIITKVNTLESVNTLVLLKESCILTEKFVSTYGFNLHKEEKNLVILIK